MCPRLRRLLSISLASLAPLGAAAEPALAQSPLPPTLAADSAFAPPTGVSRTDFTPGTIADIPAAVAVHGDRIYTVGSTQGGGSGGRDIGIIAQRPNGALDPGFSGDGKLTIPIASGTEADFGTGLAVLPDGRIRIIGATDKTVGAGESLDVVMVGLNPDGSFDRSFGDLDGAGPARTGRTTFPAGPFSDVPARIVPGPDGRLAIVGSRSDGSRDDTFVSLREADGTPVAGFGANGVRFLNRAGGTLIDRGVDVVFRPGGGLVALVLVETNPGSATDFKSVLHAFALDGNDDPSFSGGDVEIAAGDPDTVPGGLLVHNDRLWAAGYTKVGADTDAFLARVESDGSGQQVRRFDMRGRVIAQDSAVVSRAVELTVVPGRPDTLVAVGSVDFSSGGSTTTEWAAAAFNKLDGDLAQAGFGDLVLPAPGQGGLVSAAAAGDSWLAVAGSHIDTTSADNSFGTARLLVDADKECDLGVAVGEPGEVVFTGDRPAAMTVRVSNVGTRTCGGTIEARAPYLMAPVDTGDIAPGGTFTALAVPLSYTGPRRADDVMRVTVSSPADANGANNEAAAHVVFSYCDLSVSSPGAAGLIPNEGRRRFELALRNEGTTTCRVRVGAAAPYSLAAGRSVSDQLAVAAPRGARRGRAVLVTLRADADDDVDAADNGVTVRPSVVDVGDTNVLTAGARGFRGKASPGKGKVARKRLRVTAVHVAVLHRNGKGCAWLKSSRGGLGPRSKAACSRPRWLKAAGLTRWRLALRRALARGAYTVHSRATIAAGFPEARFSANDLNRVSFRVR